MKVLIVDDEPIECAGVTQILSSFNADVQIRVAENGMEALELMEQEKADIAFLDIQMPGWNGLETLKRIKSRWPDVKISLISAHGEFHYAKEAMEHGASAYMLKPVIPDELQQTYLKLCMEVEAQRSVLPLLLQAVAEKWLGIVPGVDLPEAVWKTEINFIPNLILNFTLDDRQGRRLEKREWEFEWMRANPVQGILVPQPIQGSWVYLARAEGIDQLITIREALYRLKLAWGNGGWSFNFGLGELVDSPYKLHLSYATAIQSLHVQKREVTLIQQCLAFINQNYHRALTIQDIALFVHLSPSHLSRILKRDLGMTFVDLMTQTRIEKAKELLQNPHLTIEYISDCVGFSSPNYFAVTFKKLQGISPRQYRLNRQL